MRRSGFSIIEVELAAIAGALLLITFIYVDGEVRRAFRVVTHESQLETVQRDLEHDLERQVPLALSRATDGYAGAPRPIRAGGDRLTITDSRYIDSDFVLAFTPEATSAIEPGGTLRYSLNAGGSWRATPAIGARSMLAQVKSHYGGWIDQTDMPPNGAQPLWIDPRVRYALLRFHTTLGKPEMVPHYMQKAWAPRATDWRFFHQSRQGAPVPFAEEGTFYPLAIHRQALPDDPNAPFNLFAIGPGAGNIGWLSWLGDPSTGALSDALSEPVSQYYTNPEDPSGTDHVLSLGSWIRTTPGHHQAAQDTLARLVGQTIPVVVWDDSRGQGHGTLVQASGFARVRIDEASIPTLTGRFVEWVDDQGRPLPAASPSPSPTPTASPSPVPTPATSWYPLVLPLALNAPLTLTPGADLGWLHAGADFAWLAWYGDPRVETLIESLRIPGTADTYVNPDDPTDRLLAEGKRVVGFSSVQGGKALESNLAALTGRTAVAPIFDEVEGIRFRLSGFGLVRLEAYHIGSLRLRLTFLGRCDPQGNLL